MDRQIMMSLLEEAEALLLEPRDQFDGCICGIARRAGQQDVAAYNEDQVIDVLEKQMDGDREEAREFYEFNTVSAYVGGGTPIFITFVD